MYPFKEGSFAVRNGWYVIAFRKDLKEQLMSRWILDEPIVLYRKQDASPVALSGLCPHRFFPLADSRLEKDEIICRYHGISFNGEGKCTNIPGQDNIPHTCALRAYPLVEHGLWVWIWPGDPAQADPALLPDLRQIGHDADNMSAVPFYCHEIQARYQLLNDNLMDLSHLAFLHADSIGSPANATVPEELSEAPGVLRSRRIIKNSPAPPVVREMKNYHGLLDQVSGMDFYYPGLHAGISEMTYPEAHEQSGEVIRGLRVFHAITPATRHSCYYHFAISSTDIEHVEELKEYLKKVVEEDIFASEAIEKMLAAGAAPPREVNKFSDRNSVRGRQLLQKMMDAENPA